MFRTVVGVAAVIILAGVIWRLGTPGATGSTEDALATAEVRIQALEREVDELKDSAVRVHQPLPGAVEFSPNDIVIYCNIKAGSPPVIADADYTLWCAAGPGS